jgi:putative oxidoreductase
MWIAHALVKLLVFTLPGMAQLFACVGLPGLLAYPIFAVGAFAWKRRPALAPA